MTEQDLKVELERQGRERGAQEPQLEGRVLKSEKGGVSVYRAWSSLVTLYKEQWIRLLDMKDDIRAFRGENESKLKAKE
jgi:hypothetical protein